MPALRRRNPLLAAGRRRPHGLLVPRVPERRGTEDGVSAVVIVRAPQLFDCLRAFCLGSFRALLQELEQRRRPAVRFRGAQLLRPAGALRVPAPRQTVHRVARAHAPAPTRRGACGGRAPSRARGRDLRARARRPAGGRARSTLRQRAAAAADEHRRDVRRLRLGRQLRTSARTPSSRLRSSARAISTAPSRR